MTDKPARIFLIRHGKPLVPRKGFFSLATAREYIINYDAASVEQFDRTLAQVDFDNLELVFCSTLERSKDTARKFFGDEVALHENPIFREFERRILPLPFLKLPIGLWLFLSRIPWFLGMNKREIESFKQARIRAQEAAKLLAIEAETQGQAVLVAHGMLNYFIAKSLQKNGWKQVRKGGRGFLAVNEFVRLG